MEDFNMETENTRRELNCIGGSIITKVLDVDFGYLPPTIEEEYYNPHLDELEAYKKKTEEECEESLKSYVFLHDLSNRFDWDRSNLRKFVLRHDIKVKKLRHPGLGQLCLAVTLEEAKHLIELKFGATND